MSMLLTENLNSLEPWQPDLLSLGVYAALVLLVISGLLSLSERLGQKKHSAEKRRPYESGIIPTGSAHFRYPLQFYLIAAFFLIFDIETAFIFSWAIASDFLAWAGWLEISFFIGVLLLSLFYIWKKGGLDWETKSQ